MPLCFESVDGDPGISVLEQACYPQYRLLVDLPLALVVQESLVRHVVEGARDVKQEEAGHLAPTSVPRFIDLVDDVVDRVLGGSTPPASHVRRGEEGGEGRP